MLKMKYVWTLALVALCVGLASVAFAADDWSVVAADTDLPTELAWDGTYDGTVGAMNEGDPWTVLTYELWSIEGITNPWTQTLIDRWGIDKALLSGPVANGASTVIDVALVAPPLNGTLECDWVMAKVGTGTIKTDLAEADVVVSRFPDDLPSSAGAWAAAEIEACAGRVPFIVAGFDDGNYYPLVTVTRAQMAAFVRRAMAIPQVAWVDPGTFSDVGEDFWAVGDIEALAADDATPSGAVVAGYGDGSYQPTWPVLRGQMAKFLALGSMIPLLDPLPDPATFYDVPADYPGAVYIESCFAEGLVKGFADYYGEGVDGYLPTWSVTRDQMAKFCYRAFIEPVTDPMIMVLGGPGLSALDAEAAAFDGVSTVLEDPTYAWVAFDAALLSDFTPSDGGTAGWDIEFDYWLLEDGTPSVSVATVTESIAAGDLVGLTGTYFYVSSAVPALAADSDYQLIVSVEEADGNMAALKRTVDFSTSPIL